MCKCSDVKTDKTDKYYKNRRHRYSMMDTAGSILQNERVHYCSKHVPKFGVGSTYNGIVISKNALGKAYYTGLNLCSSVWMCPVCAEKIGSTRAVEVSTAVERHVSNGGWGLFLTLTNSHKKQDCIASSLKLLSKAQSSMRRSKRFVNALLKLGYIGNIKALEVTHGKNGWHPHTHEVIFLNRKISYSELKEFKQVVFEQWTYYCKKFGLGLPNFNGVDLQLPKDMESMTRYVSKWGYELTHLNIKQGKNGSRTPFQILSDLTNKYNYRDAKLFKEYALAFKGSRQLRWSKGLKALFGIQELTDQQINEMPEQEIITVIPKADWYNILASNQRAEILEIAEQGGAAAVKEHLNKLSNILETIRYRKWIIKKYETDRIYLNTDYQTKYNFSSNTPDFIFADLDKRFNQQMTELEKRESELLDLYASNMWNRSNVTTINQLIY